MPRKPMATSVLKTLPEETQAALFEFLRENTLEAAVPWLFSEAGVRSNKSSLGEWRGWYDVQRRVSNWNAEAEDLKKLLGTDQEIDPGLVPKLAESFFISRCAEEGDAKTFAQMAGIIQRHKELETNQKVHADKMVLEDKKLQRKDTSLKLAQRKLEQAERKIAALEEQAEAAKKAAERTKEALKSGGLDDNARSSLIAELDHVILGKAKPQPIPKA